MMDSGDNAEQDNIKRPTVETVVSDTDLIELLLSERKALIERGRTVERILLRKQAITRLLILPAKDR